MRSKTGAIELAWPVRPLPSTETADQRSMARGSGPGLSAELVRVVGRNLGSNSSRRRRSRDGDPAALLDALSGVDNVLYAPRRRRTRSTSGRPIRLFHEARRLAAAMVASSSPPKLFVRDPQCATHLRRRSSQPRPCGAMGPGPHAGPGTSRNLGRRHRSRRVDARRAGRAACAGRSRQHRRGGSGRLPVGPAPCAPARKGELRLRHRR